MKDATHWHVGVVDGDAAIRDSSRALLLAEKARARRAAATRF